MQHVRSGLLAAPPAPFDWDLARAILQGRYSDLRRHFVFEYYPWYASDPYRHWDSDSCVPPVEVAASSMPLLGAYDSRSVDVLEQHARWIADAGVGAINVSWWGRDSFCDRAVPLLLDVMAADDIRVTFHLEPYGDDRGQNLADDLIYLVERYGEQRGWDAFLLLPDASGALAPVFKSCRTILPRTTVDCLGRTWNVSDYTADELWRWQTDRLRSDLGGMFDRIVLLADSLDVARTVAAGFDGIAIYDNYVAPGVWSTIVDWCTRWGLLFSFNVNPGADPFLSKVVVEDPCDPRRRVSSQISARSPGSRRRSATARVRRARNGSSSPSSEPCSCSSSRRRPTSLAGSFLST